MVLYTVTDPKGLTGSASRVMKVIAPANDNAAPTSNDATSTPVATNDNTPIVPLAAILRTWQFD
jgi:hypothetical protein